MLDAGRGRVAHRGGRVQQPANGGLARRHLLGLEQPGAHRRALLLREGVGHLAHLRVELERIATDLAREVLEVAVERLRALGDRCARGCLLREVLHKPPELGPGVELGAGEFAQDHQHQGWLDLPVPTDREQPLAHGVHQLRRLRKSTLDGVAGELQRLADHGAIGRDQLLVPPLPARLGQEHAEEVEHGLGLGFQVIRDDPRVRPRLARGNVGGHELAEARECGAVGHQVSPKTS